MNSNFFRVFVIILNWSITAFAGVTHYVDLNSPNPTTPYTNWETAATSVQDAVNAAAIMDVVLVTNGVYASGATYDGYTSNRVSIQQTLTLQSVNGPEVTIIEGYQQPGITNGPNAIRCLAISEGVVSGFTLRNGGTAATTNIFGGRGGGVWATADVVITNCVFKNNCAASCGGGVYSYFQDETAKLYNCILEGNGGSSGGGSYNSELYNCVLEGNWATASGGGSYGGKLHNCIVRNNSALSGGGLYGGVSDYCAIFGNHATEGIGGADSSYLYGCTLTGNSGITCGGAYGGRLDNCILYFNKADRGEANYAFTAVYTSCTTPLPTNTLGNISADPQLADAFHLSPTSPCRGIGRALFMRGTDIDNDPWQNPPALGCDEYTAGSITGAVSVAIASAYTDVAVGFPVDIAADIRGRVLASVWDFGDGSSVTNRPYITHTWNTAGDFPVVLTAYNESHPDGVAATVMVHVATAPVHFVAAGSMNPVPPFASWDTAANDIQSAIDVTTLPGAQVLVADGVYNSGGRAVFGTMTNRVTVDKPVIVTSVNGPASTVIAGYQVPGTTNGDGAIRGVYLSRGAVLSGFTVTNGATRSSTSSDYDHERKGGGIWCESISAVVTNCVLADNSAYACAGGAYWGTLSHCELKGNSGSYGGGAYGGVLRDCTLLGNLAGNNGGGAHGGSLERCTLIGNTARMNGGGANMTLLSDCILTGNIAGYGGGAAGGTMTNCTLFGNSAINSGGAAMGSVLIRCFIANNTASVGGGTRGGMVNACVITNNSASRSGGGASEGSFNSCVIAGNTAMTQGGGVYSGFLSNCTVTSNSAQTGGGTYQATLYNCILYYNTAAASGTNYDQGTMNFCCTTPLPASGTGNFSEAPLLLDLAGGDLHLQSNSPCINAGRNGYVGTSIDLDGNPRIVGGTVDLGAYEFQSPASLISYAWLRKYGLPTDGSADGLDPDLDGMNNWQEWTADTDPTNAASVLRLLTPAATTSAPVTLSWQSSSNRTYFVECATDLGAQTCFSCIASNVAGRAPTTSFTDTNAPVVSRALYRVGVRLP